MATPGGRMFWDRESAFAVFDLMDSLDSLVEDAQMTPELAETAVSIVKKIFDSTVPTAFSRVRAATPIQTVLVMYVHMRYNSRIRQKSFLEFLVELDESPFL